MAHLLYMISLKGRVRMKMNRLFPKPDRKEGKVTEGVNGRIVKNRETN